MAQILCVCVLFLGKFLHCDNKEKWEIFVFLRIISKEIAKYLENFTELSKHKISSRKKNPAQNVMLPRIIANVAVAASQASPDKSKTDFAIPFPVPVSPNT
jgi:hypothetical protein